ncbi:MAG TPA: efflux RND transporter periplasmic adaptor subunit [Vicinamibacterales bacterium]|jgi:RND family efflux transporter MFP subunit|nr:efflux RND transporter periplasmic adaptor subunit [Vicinamibacterales bacterium]
MFSYVRRHSFIVLAAAVSLAGASVTGCSSKTSAEEPPVASAAVPTVTTVAVESRPIDRFIRVTGSLTADEQAEVSAEIGGRIVGTPVERGTRVSQGDVLVRVSPAETSAQLQEAEANAEQIEARLGLKPGDTFDPKAVPDVMNARASLEFAEAEFGRIRSLLDQKVVSQSEFDQRRTQVEAARQQYLVAQNSAEQSYRSLQAARARVALARKAMSDTAVRAPFSGIVAERLVSVGDYVTRGTRVATVVRIDPMRVELTVPEQAVSLIHVGQSVRLSVDAYANELFEAKIRFVSPSLRADQRALTVEAIAPNTDGRLKPGLFATASIQQPQSASALLVFAKAVETVSGTSRVYVIKDGSVEERIVTLGERVGDQVELTSGVSKGETVVAEPNGRLTDGMKVQAQ